MFTRVIVGIVVSMLAGTVAAQGPGSPRANPLLSVFDQDGDGRLSAAEIEGASTKLSALDASRDGTLSGEELRSAMPRGGRGGGGRRGGGRQPEMGTDELQKETLAQDDVEAKILATLKAMWGRERFLNVSPLDGRLLRMLTEAAGAKRVVELGTSTGESGLWLALALQSTGGKLFTHEIDPGRAATARQNFEAAGVGDIVTVIEGDAHETVTQHQEPIDVIFLDADKEGYIDYLNKLLPLVNPGGLVIAHNMNSRQADPAFVKAITERPELETLILLREGGGVSVTLKKR